MSRIDDDDDDASYELEPIPLYPPSYFREQRLRWERQQRAFAMDAAPQKRKRSPFARLLAALGLLRSRWLRIFNEHAEDIATSFVKANERDTQADLKRRLKEAGFSIRFNPDQDTQRRIKLAMGKNGFDTREHGEIDRPLVLGEISHPDDPSEKVPVTLSEGRQKTSKHDSKGHGRRHIEFGHGQEIRDAGFEDALDFISHIVSHHNEDVTSSQHHSRNLSIKRKGKGDFMGALHLLSDGGHYRVTTAHPENKRNKKEE